MRVTVWELYAVLYEAVHTTHTTDTQTHRHIGLCARGFIDFFSDTDSRDHGVDQPVTC